MSVFSARYLVVDVDITSRAQDLHHFAKKLNLTSSLSDFDQVATLTASPVPWKSSSTDVINIDNKVLTWLFVGGALCAAVLTFTSKPKSALQAITAWLENIWRNFCLLFSETGISESPSSWRARMVFTTWLFTVMIFTIYVGSYLKSSFTTTTYDLVDRYQDVMPYGDDVKFGQFAFSVADAIECSLDEKKKYSELACLNLENKRPLRTTFELWLTKPSFPWRKYVMLTSLTELKRETRQIIKDLRKSGNVFYLGQFRIDTFIYFALHDKIRRNQFLMEQFLKSALVLLETKAMSYENLEGDFMLESILWKKPAEDGTVLHLEDSLLVFKIWVYGTLMSCALLLFEVCWYFLWRLFTLKNQIYPHKIQFLQ